MTLRVRDEFDLLWPWLFNLINIYIIKKKKKHLQVLSNMVNMEQIISNSRGDLKYASWVWSHSETCGDAITQTE